MSCPAQSLIKRKLHTRVTPPHASERCGHTQFLPVKHSGKHLKAELRRTNHPREQNFCIFMMEKRNNSVEKWEFQNIQTDGQYSSSRDSLARTHYS